VLKLTVLWVLILLVRSHLLSTIRRHRLHGLAIRRNNNIQFRPFTHKDIRHRILPLASQHKIRLLKLLLLLLKYGLEQTGIIRYLINILALLLLLHPLPPIPQQQYLIGDLQKPFILGPLLRYLIEPLLRIQ
jgi:hypothetical protein